MKIDKINIENIIPYENNAKLHPAEQVEQIKKSIQEFGFNDPIAIDENGVVIEGHGRLIALKELGWTEVPCIRITGLTDEQKRAYILVHNKLTINTDFDFNILDSELAKIKEINMKDFDFEELSISENDFDTFFELNSEDKPKARKITLTLSEVQYNIAQRCIEVVQDRVENDGICNTNGSAVYEIMKEWEQMKNGN